MNLVADLAASLAVFFWIGLTPTQIYFLKSRRRKNKFFLPLAVLQGQSIILILSTWAYYSKLPLSDLVPFSLVLFSLTNVFLFFLWARPKENVPGRIVSHIKGNILPLLLGMLAVLTILWAAIGARSTTAFRIGPDGALYAAITEQFSSNGNLETIDALNPEKALAYDGIKIHKRVGFPFLTSFIKNFLGKEHAYETLFLVSASSLLSLFFMCGYFFERVCGIGNPVAVFLPVGLLWNSNLVNAFLENQHPQIVALPFIFAAVLIFLFFRSWLSIFVLAPIFAGLILVYSESLLLFGLLFIISFAIQWRRSKLDRRRAKGYILFGAGLLLGGLLVWPQSAEVFKHLVRLNPNVGYPQPLWALPSDILGFSNIYSHPKTWLENGALVTLKRSWWLSAFSWSLTLIVVFVVFEAFTKIKRLKSIASISGACLLVALIIFFRSNSMGNNYLYMKGYVTLLPLVFSISSVCFFFFLRKIAKFGPIFKGAVGITVMALILASFTDYMRDYKILGKIILPQHYELKEIRKIIDEKDYIIFRKRGQSYAWTTTLDRTEDIYLSVLTGGRVAAPEEPVARYAGQLDQPVFLLLRRTSYREQPLWRGGDFVLVPTGKKLQDSVLQSDGRFDFSVFWN